MEHKTLFHRDFILVVLGQIISLFGNAALRLALPLYLLDATGSEALFGLVSALSFGALVVISPIGGALADRLPKAKIMAVLDFITCALTGGLALLLDLVPLVPLLLIGLTVLYAIQGVYQPAVSASVPALVPEEKLVSANGVINQVNALSQLVGPVLGGILYDHFGLLPVLWLAGGCFFLSAFMELFIQIPHHPQAKGDHLLAILKKDTLQATGFLLRERPQLARCVGLVCLLNMAMSAMLIVGLPILIRKQMGLDGIFYGAAEGAMALGGLAGGILAGVLGERLSPKLCPRLLALCGLLTLGMAFPLAAEFSVPVRYGTVIALAAVLMSITSLFSVIMLSYIQGQTPEHLMGKVMAWVVTLGLCASPVGQAAYGVLFQVCPAWVTAAAGGTAALLIAAAARNVFRQLPG